MVTIYGIKNCDTMKKAFAWLDAAGIAYSFHDYKKSGNLDTVITELDRAVKDAQFQNVAALTQLATFQMQRGGAVPWQPPAAGR